MPVKCIRRMQIYEYIACTASEDAKSLTADTPFVTSPGHSGDMILPFPFCGGLRAFLGLPLVGLDSVGVLYMSCAASVHKA